MKQNIILLKYITFLLSIFIFKFIFLNTSFGQELSPSYNNKSRTATNSNPCFVIGDKPFLFVGGFVGGGHFGNEFCTDEINEDLIKTAKENGVNVLHLMLPGIESELGVFDELEMAKLDNLLNYARIYGVYVMISFIHGYGIAIWEDDPYYHPGGIEGLITDVTLKEAFKKRIEYIINHINSFNDIRYKDDSTIMAWILVDEPISAPWNYPQGPPNVTVEQLNNWFEEMASYVKILDSNHLVTVMTTAAIDQMNDWLKAFDVPSLDFIEPEDADMRIMHYFNNAPPEDYPLRLFSFDKPIVIYLSFTSGLWDQSSICNDYTWQAETLKKAMQKYFELGTAGIVVFSWGSNLYPNVLECFNYNSSIDSICQVFKETAAEIGTLNWPSPPLQFVKIQSETNVEIVNFDVPLSFYMKQNYPNPFNLETTIKYNLPKSSNVTLKIFNIVGQEIETLINEYQISGEHRVKWIPEGLPSGIYFYRLQSNKYSESKKLILQK